MILLDTSFLIAYEVDTDSNHERAVSLRERITREEFGPLIISDYIFDEILTVTFSKTKNLEKTIIIGMELRNSSILIKLNDKDFEETWELFKKQKNTKFSFTDSSNVALMKRMGIKNIATFDEDFKKIKEINVIGA